MRLLVHTPIRVEVDQDVDSVTVQAIGGSFAMLPHHVDITAPLRAGLLSFRADGIETVIAVDGGVVVKCGSEVLVSTPRLVRGPELEDLERTVTESFRTLEERDRTARAALARLESDIIRRFVEVDDHA